ncbi:MAG: AsmA-like C-terminal region-containing protein [Vicinamibacterales bacterium]
MSRRLRIVLAAVVAITAVAGLGVMVAIRQLEPRLHAWVTESLGKTLQSEVALGEVHLAWFPFRLTARDLTVRHRGRTDIPPLIVVSTFTVDLNPRNVWNSTIDHVQVDGMEVHIPPKDAETGKRPIPRPGGSGGEDSREDSDDGSGIVVRRLTATNTRLAVIPRTKGKNPKVWDIFELEMEDLGAGGPARFRAALTNPIPYGKIESAGRFGPWDSAEPGRSGLEGEYTFAADLGTIKGLQGQLSAIGTMSGVLEQIATRGETRTPDFKLTALDGSSMPLTTTYDALVDGTKGDVELQRVDIMLGRSPLHATGLVEGTSGVKGKRVIVNISSKAANLAELLALTSKAQPPMARGTVSLDAAFDLPQGDADVLDRLELEGSFRADRMRFADGGVQDKIDELSRRGQGRPRDESIENMASGVSSRFKLAKGVLAYRGLAFTVRGAAIKLDGTHRLESKALSLGGEVLLTASASNTLTGLKRWLVKPFDALFRKKGAGTRLVIRVEGTQDHPKVALELGKTLRGK